MAGVFGSSVSRKINISANAVHSALFQSTGIQAGLDGMKHDQADLALAQKVGSGVAVYFAKEADSRIRALSVQMYSVILRCVVLLAWIMFLLPFLTAAVYDGFQMRHVKFASMGHQNPTAFSLGFHVSVLMCAVPMLSVVVPMYIVTPLFMPFWVIITALPVSFAIRHTQPIFTK